MNVGDYVRTEISSLNIQRIGKIKEIIGEYFIHTDIGTYDKENIIKSSPNIIDLLQPMDLIYVDIDNNYASGIIVPRIAETQAELNLMIDLIKSGKWILKGIVTKEQLDSMRYEVGE